MKKGNKLSITAPVAGKNAKSHQEDIDAVAAVVSGDKNKFAILYKRYYPIIFQKYSTSLKFNKEVVEDLTAELFLRVYQNLDKFKPEYTFNSWITRVAQNHLIDHTRKNVLDTVPLDAGMSSEKMRSDESEFMVFEIADDYTPTPEQGIITSEKNELVRNAIEGLDETCRTAINKLFMEEKSYTEISQEMNLPLGSVKSIIFRGKEKLKSIIEANPSMLAAVLS
jgi:RNA polymerase sigma-70 factor (ECF subfamily)